MRAVAAQGVIDFPAPGVPDPTKNITEAGRFIDRWQGLNPLITPAVFVHSPYTCSSATLQNAKELALVNNVPLFIHVAESSSEPDMINNMQGGSPVKHLEALGILDSKTICVHCVWVDEEDLDILAERDAGVVVCPQSHLKLASGISPLKNMLAKGIRVGLGTDGAASNNSLDMFREMDICAKIQKIRFRDPVAVPATEILKMATIGGTKVLGTKENVGHLVPGNRADIILVELNTPHLQPIYGTNLLVYAADGADVQTVLINGKPVMLDRTIVSFDLEETLHNVRKLVSKIIAPHQAASH
jgi:5-methylthioadenosine/S-adenosylhomocysteine deaminase